MKIKIQKFVHKFSEVIIFVTAIVLISIVFDTAFIGMADNRLEEGDEWNETSDEQGEDLTDDEIKDALITDFDCLATIYEGIEPLEEDFDKFITEALLSDAPGSEVSELLVDKYEEYINNVESLYEEAVYVNTTGSLQSEIYSDITLCRDVVDQFIEEKEIILAVEASASSYGKKTTALLDEYKWINTNLVDMNERVSYLNAYIEEMNNLLSGFTKSCVKQ